MEELIKTISLTESERCNHLSYDFIKKLNETVIAHNNLFQIGQKSRDLQPLVQLYKNEWWVNRYVGEVIFPFEGVLHKVIIEPRFGEVYLFKLLQPIFNFQFANSYHSISKSKRNENYLKQIIAKIWVSQLGQANKYGLPRKKFKVNHYGPQIKGKLDVRGSINIFYSKRKLKSTYYQKGLDFEVSSLLHRAFTILIQDYGLPHTSILPKTVQDIIHQLDYRHSFFDKGIEEFNVDKLSSVYGSFKNVLLLSKDIIKKRNKENKTTEKNSEGYSFLLDMAEVWELYLLNLFKTLFSNKGWSITSPTVTAYPNKFFKRDLIPDIVLSKDTDVVIFDAKYKFMRGQGFDIDRTDFFQIHTYMSYFEKYHQVKLAGLIYPFSNPISNSEKRAISMINDNSGFIVDGLNFEALKSQIGEEQKLKLFDEIEQAFLENMESHL